MSAIFGRNKNTITGPLVQKCTVTNEKIEITIKPDSIDGDILLKKESFGFEVSNSQNVKINIY